MNIKSKIAIPAVVLALVAGAATTVAFQTHAADTTPTPAVTPTATADGSTTQSSGTPPAQRDPSLGGHTANGITETLLTGDTATKAKAAALAAVPGGTIQRVETDAEGAVYEAHMLNASGSPVTVKLDANFNVTGTETGGPSGHGGPGNSSNSSTSTN